MSEVEYKYNENGIVNQKKVTFFDEDNKEKYNIVYDLDDAGNVTKHTKYSPDGTIIPDATAGDIQNKINEQFKVKSTEDVDEMVGKIMQASGATEEEALYALQMMTQYGNMKNLNELGKKLSSDEYSIANLYDKNGVSANAALSYLVNSKHQIDLRYSGKTGYILDDAGLKYLESIQGTAEAQKIVDDLIDGKIVFIYPKGWNSGYSIYTSGADDSEVAEKTADIISAAKQIQSEQGITFEEAFDIAANKDTLDRIEALGLEDEVKTVDLSDETSPLKVGDADSSKIAENMSHFSITEEKIAEVVEEIANRLYPDGGPECEKAIELINGYFNAQLDVYSPERLGEIMQEMHSKILETAATLTKSDGSAYTEEDIVYVVPVRGKSYDQVALQYATVNGIDYDSFVFRNVEELSNLPDDGKIYVVLDDVVGSGDSMLRQGVGYENINAEKMGDRHIFMVPIVSGSTGAEKINDTIANLGREGADFLLIPDERIQTPYYDTEYYQSLSESDREMLDYILLAQGGFGDGLGYGDKAGYAILFPYMAPDNDASICYYLFKHLIQNPDAIKSQPAKK